MFLENPKTKRFLISGLLPFSLNATVLGTESVVTQNLHVHKELFKIALGEGRIRDAEKEMRTCLTLDSKDAGLHYEYGRLLWKENKLTSALIQLRQAALLSPENAEFQRTYRKAASQAKGPSNGSLRIKRAVLSETDTDEAVGDFENSKLDSAIPTSPSDRVRESC